MRTEPSIQKWASVLLILMSTIAIVAVPVQAQRAAAMTQGVRNYITVDAPVIALTHVQLIDGTGMPARADQTVVIENGRIAAVGKAADVKPPAGAQVIDLTGHQGWHPVGTGCTGSFQEGGP